MDGDLHLSAAAVRTLPDLFNERVRLTPDQEAYRQFSIPANRWISYTWAQMHVLVLQYRLALRAERLPAGARIAILLPNSVEHVCMDQAALALGLVPVPLHVIDNPENLGFVQADYELILEALIVRPHGTDAKRCPSRVTAVLSQS
jgi:long-chain acyl-CoA synthetase